MHQGFSFKAIVFLFGVISFAPASFADDAREVANFCDFLRYHDQVKADGKVDISIGGIDRNEYEGREQRTEHGQVAIQGSCAQAARLNFVITHETTRSYSSSHYEKFASQVTLDFGVPNQPSSLDFGRTEDYTNYWSNGQSESFHYHAEAPHHSLHDVEVLIRNADQLDIRFAGQGTMSGNAQSYDHGSVDVSYGALFSWDAAHNRVTLTFEPSDDFSRHVYEMNYP